MFGPIVVVTGTCVQTCLLLWGRVLRSYLHKSASASGSAPALRVQPTSYYGENPVLQGGSAVPIANTWKSLTSWPVLPSAEIRPDKPGLV